MATVHFTSWTDFDAYVEAHVHANGQRIATINYGHDSIILTHTVLRRS